MQSIDAMLRSATQRVLQVPRSVVRRLAADRTATVAQRSALVLAPHPDDETIGCGACILRKLAAGANVTVVVFTDGRNSHQSPYLSADELAAIRRAEVVQAAARLGLPTHRLRQLGYPDGALSEHENDAVDVIVDLVKELQPDEIYVTGAFEPQADHAALGRAARRALERIGPQSPALFEYPIWLWLTVGRSGPALVRQLAAAARVLLLLRRAVTVVTAPFSQQKMFAVDAFASQIRRPDGVPSDHAWRPLPSRLLANAADSVEIYLPWRPTGG